MSSFENRDGIIPLSVFPALRKKLEILQISELGLFKTNIRRTKLRQSGQQRLMFESGSIFAHLLKPSDRLPKISTYRTIEFTSVRFGQIIQRNFYFQRFETPHPATVITVATMATVRKRSDRSVTTTRSPRFARFFFFFGLRRGSLSRPMLGS